jgi:hypothetical protein
VHRPSFLDFLSSLVQFSQAQDFLHPPSMAPIKQPTPKPKTQNPEAPQLWSALGKGGCNHGAQTSLRFIKLHSEGMILLTNIHPNLRIVCKTHQVREKLIALGLKARKDKWRLLVSTNIAQSLSSL